MFVFFLNLFGIDLNQGMSAATTNHSRQTAFWKKHQSLLQNCADLTLRGGARVLVGL